MGGYERRVEPTSTGPSNDAQLRGNIDYGTSLVRMIGQRLLLHHLGEGGPGSEPGSFVIYIGDEVESGCGGFVGAQGLAENTGTVDGVIEAREGLENIPGEGIDESLVANVARATGDLRLRVDGEDGITRPSQRLPVEVGDGDTGAAGSGEGFCYSGADAWDRISVDWPACPMRAHDTQFGYEARRRKVALR